MGTKKNNLKKEAKRQKRVCNMMRDMHSNFFHRYRAISYVFKVLIIFLSVSMGCLVFASRDVLYAIFKSDNDITLTLILGCFSLAILLLSLAQLIFDFDKVATEHYAAFKVYNKHLFDIRNLLNENKITVDKLNELSYHYSQQTMTCRSIPSRSFNRQKAHFMQKVRMSMLISENDGKLNLRDIKRLCRSEKQEIRNKSNEAKNRDKGVGTSK